MLTFYQPEFGIEVHEANEHSKFISVITIVGATLVVALLGRAVPTATLPN